MNENFIKKIYLINAIVVMIAIFPLPIGYYTFTRIVVFISMTLLIYYYKTKNKSVSNNIIIYALIGILFNPIIPIYLHNSFIWSVIDFILFLFMTYNYFKIKSK